MAQQHYRTPFKKALLQFITEPDPFLAMLKWVMTEMMRIEAEAKVGAAKGKHAKERTNVLLRGAGPEGGYPDGDGLSSRAQGPQGRLCAVLHLGATAVRAGADRGRSRGLHQRGLDPEDRAAGPGDGHRKHLRRQVSEFNKELDSQVADFKTRPLAEEYPFLWIDALYQKVRVEGRVVSVAVMIACGVNPPVPGRSWLWSPCSTSRRTPGASSSAS